MLLGAIPDVYGHNSTRFLIASQRGNTHAPGANGGRERERKREMGREISGRIKSKARNIWRISPSVLTQAKKVRALKSGPETNFLAPQSHEKIFEASSLPTHIKYLAFLRLKCLPSPPSSAWPIARPGQVKSLSDQVLLPPAKLIKRVSSSSSSILLPGRRARTCCVV